MRLLDTDTRYFDFNFPGSPQLTNSWGDLIKVLDFCLVTGSEYKKIYSITCTDNDKEHNNLYWLCKIVLESKHGFEKLLSVVKIVGSSIPEYNGIHRVQDIGDNYIIIALDKNLIPDKPQDSLTEIIDCTIKLEPLGYEKTFSAIDKGAYINKDLNRNNNIFLRVDNSCPIGYDPTWAKFARVSMISDMRDIEDYNFIRGRDKAPSYLHDYTRAEEQFGAADSGIYGESKWYYSLLESNSSRETYAPTNNFSKKWEVIGDNRTFYFFIEALTALSSAPGGSVDQRAGYCFGEYTEYFDVNNIKNYILIANEVYNQASFSSNFNASSSPGHIEKYNSFARTGISHGKYILNADQKETHITSEHEKFEFKCMIGDGAASGDSTTNSDVDRLKPKVSFMPVGIKTTTARVRCFKGYMRGYNFLSSDIQFMKNHLGFFKHKEVITNLDNFTFVLLSTALSSGTTNNGDNTRVAFNIGNWG